MTSEANHHPSPEMLGEFAQGNLSAGLSVALSAHLEICASCREQSRQAEARATVTWLETPVARDSDSFTHLVDDIVRQPQLKESMAGEYQVNEIHMLERSVTLPRVLARAASQGLVWKKLAGGINQASITLDSETQCEFIYMKPGSQVPVHRHQGNEITLVLDGSFTDDLGHYQVSDFVVRNNEHTHQPASEEGCLCFAVLDSPLMFTSGLARLLNPINRYRFRRATAS